MMLPDVLEVPHNGAVAQLAFSFQRWQYLVNVARDANTKEWIRILVRIGRAALQLQPVAVASSGVESGLIAPTIAERGPSSKPDGLLSEVTP